ncbi:MAG TPA: hypothetical protein P5102_02285 [Candidatus Competibacteraceae bacterium]|nr:hypothetical protein [Candidatus Competibacteraceae bacterium]
MQSEIRPYIEHRLHVVGWRGDSPHFDESAYTAIHRYTQGVPRRVNVFCDRLLLYGFLEEMREFPEAAVDAVGREMVLDEQGGRVEARTHSNSPLLRIGQAMEQRLVELEQTVETLLQYPEWQDAQLERLEKRIQRLESARRTSADPALTLNS